MEARTARAPLRAVPAGDGSSPAYQHLASDLRQAIATGRYPAGQRLPTEAELVSSTGLSRQTVRRAFQELVSEGVIYRIRGRGTFAVPGDGKYLRSFGSIDDLMALSLDSEMQVVEPLHVLASVAVAGQLQTAGGTVLDGTVLDHTVLDDTVLDHTVMSTSFLRLHDGLPFAYTRVHVPAEIGRRLRQLPELAALAEPGDRARFTMISLVDRVSDHPIHSAVQDATAVAASADISHWLGCPAGVPILRIERIYRDRNMRPLELAINHFHPERYSYRLQLRGRVDRPPG